MRQMATRIAKAGLTGAVMLPVALQAETLIIEAHSEGENRQYYSEPTGEWQDHGTSSLAEGLSVETRSRILLPDADDVLDGSARFAPTLEESGTYSIDVAWPQDSNAAGTTIRVNGPDVEDSIIMNFTPGTIAEGSDNRWVRIGTYTLPENAEVQVTVDANSSEEPVDEMGDHALAISAMRFSNEDLGAADPPILSRDAATMGEAIDPPFDTPPETLDNLEEESPFTADPEVDAEPESPFAQQDPFTEFPGEGTELSPFVLEEGETVEEDPFEDFPTESPFAQAPQDDQTTSPFGEEQADDPDPFAQQPQQEAPSPFDGAEQTQQDPFAQAQQQDAPSPFQQEGTAEAPSPFGENEETPTEPQDMTDAGQQMAQQQQAQAAMEAQARMAAPEPTPEQLVDLDFHSSIDQAKEAARQSGKPVLIFFSGESTQANSFERLMRQKNVADKLDEFELVRINYRENRPLAREYAVTSFPYIVVLNRLGYTIGHVLPKREADPLITELSTFTQRFYENL
jgi:hypothetical protein